MDLLVLVLSFCPLLCVGVTVVCVVILMAGGAKKEGKKVM